MSFLDCVLSDNSNVILNVSEYAEKRTIIYDGNVYSDIPVVLSAIKEQSRKQTVTSNDHGEGLYLAAQALHCVASDIGGSAPEKGQRIEISDAEVPTFYRSFYVITSRCDMGLVKAELEAIDE